jgi:hypothetical protein
MTREEKNYMVDIRCETLIKQHGSPKKAIIFLNKELKNLNDNWGYLSSDSAGHAIACMSLMKGWIERGEIKYSIGDFVIVPSIYENEIFEVVGIRKTEIELEGDWSGGTHNLVQSSWVKKSDLKPCKPYLKKL